MAGNLGLRVTTSEPAQELALGEPARFAEQLEVVLGRQVLGERRDVCQVDRAPLEQLEHYRKLLRNACGSNPVVGLTVAEPELLLAVLEQRWCPLQMDPPRVHFRQMRHNPRLASPLRRQQLAQARDQPLIR